jgi:hypothetical protein
MRPTHSARVIGVTSASRLANAFALGEALALGAGLLY